MQYRAEEATLLKIVPLDSLTAIYHRKSGHTHIVSEPVPQIIAALAAPATLTELCARLDVAEAAEASALVAERLAELCAAGLVVAR